ncbi:MAG: hypothetical protein FWH18_07860 [Marinilabiliaceae bacterium]|nr:hypothetical protein [Marinilabiliaceae bacterium]
MKLKISVILALFAVFATLNSCRCNIHYLELSKTQQQMIPYELGQTINFVDSVGKKFDVVVISDTTYWENPIVYHYNCEIYREYREVTLRSDSENLEIALTIYGEAKEIDNLSLIISIAQSDIVIKYFTLGYDKKGRFRNYESYFGSQNLYERFEINSHVYCEVLENQFSFYVIYFNKTYGILQIKIKDEIIFTIDN